MKYKKPVAEIERMRKFIDEWVDGAPILAFLDSLPDEFEILGLGERAVKWPEWLTRDKLNHLATFGSWSQCTNALFQLAAIAPDRKNPTKRRISVLQFQGHGETYGKLELSFNV